MKLYYSPGACSLSPHILAHEAGIKLDLVKVDLANKTAESGADFSKINPKGYVPALELDNGEVITEGVVIGLYISSLKPEAKITPQPTDAGFRKFLELMLFITTEIHKGMGNLFAPLPEEAKEMMRKRLGMRLAFMAEQLKGKQYLFGDTFSAADAYLFTVLGWAPKVKVDLAEWPVFAQYQQRLAERPSVQEAMKMEGLPVPVKKAA